MDESRLVRLQDSLKASSLCGALLHSEDFNPDIFYLTGYEGQGALIIPSKGEPILIVPGMEKAKAEPSNCEIKVYGKIPFDSIKESIALLKEPTKSWGFDAKSLSSFMEKNLLKDNNWQDISQILASARSIKDSSEVSILKKAARLTDKILDKTIKNWSGFKTEADIAAFMDFQAAKAGARNSFPTIIASGKNSGIPHHHTSTTKLKKGFCVIDFGINFKGYCSDITRTVCVGRPSAYMEEVYQAVHQAQLIAFKASKPNASCKELDQKARDSLKNLSQFFNHGLGHGIGLVVHEAPWLNQRSDDILQENMCFTLEPGVYEKGGGVRIEDDVVIEKGKPFFMTKSKKDLIVL